MDFSFVKDPVFAPSCCTICSRAEDHYGFVDCGRDLSARGPLQRRVYVCSSCARQLGMRAGLLAPEAADGLRAQLAAQAARIEALAAELAQARGAGEWTFVPETVDAEPDMFPPEDEIDGAPYAAKCPECGERELDLHSPACSRPDKERWRRMTASAVGPLVCPDCGREKSPRSKRCSPCHIARVNAAKQGAVA